jgi:hypothetical protein
LSAFHIIQRVSHGDDPGVDGASNMLVDHDYARPVLRQQLPHFGRPDVASQAPPGRYSDMGIEKDVAILGKIGKRLEIRQPAVRKLVAVSHDAFWIHADDTTVHFEFGRTPDFFCHSISEQTPAWREASKNL